MANLSTYSTIHGKVQKYKVDYELADFSTAFTWVCLEAILNLNEDEIDDAITDGGQDGGIDALYITGQEVHVFNFKYAETFENSKNNFPESEIDKIITTMDGIYTKTIMKENVNDVLWEKVNDIWEQFENGPISVKYYLCSNKETLVEPAKHKFENSLNKYRFVEYYYYNQEDVLSKILEKKYKKVDGQIRFVDLQYFDRSDGPLKGIVATVAANDLINLVKDPNNPAKLNEDIFNENVRIYLKLSNPINQSIFETALSDENFTFWYLNNGITIVCEECIYVPNSRSPVVSLTKLQIVNGGQTTHALFEAYQKDNSKLNNVLVLVRICETKKDYHISEKISETTNSQTPVRTRDLHANDRIQLKLEEQFRSLRYFYERKKNQFQQHPKHTRLDNELLGQIYLAYYLDMPSEAKNQKSLIFNEKYNYIFDENVVTAQKMLLPYLVYLPLEKMKKEIQFKKRRKETIDEKEAFISRATFHLLNGVKHIAEKENIDLTVDTNAQRAIAKAIALIDEVVTTIAHERGSLYTHDKFFKEVPTNKTIRDYILSKY